MIKVSFVEENESLVVKLEGDLDIDSTELIDEKVLPHLLNFKKVHFNLEKVPFVDSSGIGLLLNMIQTLEEKMIKVTISHIQTGVREVFDLLQIPEILGEGILE